MGENNFEKDLSKSSIEFFKHEKQFIEDLNLDSILDVEKQDGDITKLIDRFAGIDLIFKKGNALFSVANRIQYDRDWSSFTVRYTRRSGSDTEYSKRIESIENGSMIPVYTLQSYVDKNSNLLSYCLIDTKVLYKYIKENISTITKRTTASDGNVFLVITFKELKDIAIKTYKKGQK